LNEAVSLAGVRVVFLSDLQRVRRYFRPIILPNPPTFPNPAATHTVVSINDNGAVVQGSAM